MVFTGIDGYVYWGVEGTELSGDPSTDQNIPFNPCKLFKPPKPSYSVSTVYTPDQLEPKYKYTGELTPKTQANSHAFRDPFLLLACFTHKATGGTWVTGDGTISADFSDVDDVDTMFIQYRLPDKSGGGNNLDRLVKGVLPMSYTWKMEKGKLLMEEVSLMGRDFDDNTQAMSCDNSFHDQAWGDGVGGWADWDTDGKRAVKDMKIHWNDVVIDGLDIKSGSLKLDIGYESDQVMSELSHTIRHRSVRDFTLSLNGALADKGEIEEAEKEYKNRTTNTIKVYYDNTTNYEKFLQITNVAVEKHDIINFPESGKKVESSVTFKGGESCEASFSGTWENHADPSSIVTTS